MSDTLNWISPGNHPCFHMWSDLKNLICIYANEAFKIWQGSEFKKKRLWSASVSVFGRVSKVFFCHHPNLLDGGERPSTTIYLGVWMVTESFATIQPYIVNTDITSGLVRKSLLWPFYPLTVLKLMQITSVSGFTLSHTPVCKEIHWPISKLGKSTSRNPTTFIVGRSGGCRECSPLMVQLLAYLTKAKSMPNQ